MYNAKKLSFFLLKKPLLFVVGYYIKARIFKFLNMRDREIIYKENTLRREYRVIKYHVIKLIYEQVKIKLGLVPGLVRATVTWVTEI